jgi:uncharacterized LabA/DUF88 family protein
MSINQNNNIPLIPNYCFIDGQNLETYFYKLSMKIDLLNLYQYLTINLNAKVCFYFVKAQSPKSDYILNLKKIGFRIIYGNAKHKKTSDGRISFNIDSELIVNAVSKYFEKENHNLFLLSGDGDYLPLIKFYEFRNRNVKIISPSKHCTSPYLIYNKSVEQNRNIIYLDNPNIWPKIMTPFGVEGIV